MIRCSPCWPIACNARAYGLCVEYDWIIESDSCLQEHRGLFPAYELGETNPDKRSIIARYARDFGAVNCIETGTHLGDTSSWMSRRRVCDRVWTIEVDGRLARDARRRFEEEGLSNVQLLEGDSGRLLHDAMFSRERMPGPALWWLDGHNSVIFGSKGEEDTPLLKELHAIFERDHPDDVIIVDDARTFRSTRLHQKYMQMPELMEVQDYVCEQRPDWIFDMRDDIVRIHRNHLLPLTNTVF